MRGELRKGAVGVLAACGLLLAPGAAEARTDIDPCGTKNYTTTVVSPKLEFETGKGPAALRCGAKEIGFPPFAPMDVFVEAPDAAQIDAAFKTGFPYMIGSDGQEVTFHKFSTLNELLETFGSAGLTFTFEVVAAQLAPPISWAIVAGAVVQALVEGALVEIARALISESEAMQGADWDWTVPSDTATGDWYAWFTWTGTGGYVDENHPAITPSSINPALANWYVYNINDPYYQERKPAPYARVYLGASQVSLGQGPGITATAENIATNAVAQQTGICWQKLPGCLDGAGLSSASSVADDAAEYRRRAKRRAGKALRQHSAKQERIRATGRNDEVRAHKGIGLVRAGAGHDQVLAGRGGNRLFGEEGHDELTSFSGADLLHGGAGHDVLQGGGGDDRAVGAAGSDSLFDARGDDVMLAGGGDDRIVVRDGGDDAGDRVHCGAGTDIVIADPGDRIALRGGGTADVGAFTPSSAPAGSTCELVYSTANPAPRIPPDIGEHAGRPRNAPEPRWPILD